MSNELVEKLRLMAFESLDESESNLLHEAADALGAKAAPRGTGCVAYVTGQFAGRAVIEPVNRAAVLPTGMALYSAPQPVPAVAALVEALERVGLTKEEAKHHSMHNAAYWNNAVRACQDAVRKAYESCALSAFRGEGGV